MNLDELIEKIRLESQMEIERDRKAHEEKLERLRQEFETKKAALEKSETEKCLREIEREQRRMISAEEVAWHRNSLKKKREAVDKAIENGISAFTKSGEYKTFVDTALSRIPAGATVHAHESDRVVRKSPWIKKKKLRLAPAEISCGFSYSCGKERVILSVDSLLAENRVALEREIAKILFE